MTRQKTEHIIVTIQNERIAFDFKHLSGCDASATLKEGNGFSTDMAVLACRECNASLPVARASSNSFSYEFKC